MSALWTIDVANHGSWPALATVKELEDAEPRSSVLWPENRANYTSASDVHVSPYSAAGNAQDVHQSS